MKLTDSFEKERSEPFRDCLTIYCLRFSYFIFTSILSSMLSKNHHNFAPYNGFKHLQVLSLGLLDGV